MIPRLKKNIHHKAFYILILLVSIIFCLHLPTTAYAEETIPEGLKYSISDNEVTITGYDGLNSKLTVPELIEGYPVTSIGDRAFLNCTVLTDIVMPNSIRSIGSAALYGCSSLKSIILSSCLNNIGDSAFAGCSSLTQIILPESITTIRNNAFQNCTSLESINIPSNISRIWQATFYNCCALKEVHISQNVKCIEANSFANCISLSTVTIDYGVETIGNYAFSGCTSLAVISIPSSVTAIGQEAFSNCSNLSIVVLSDNITRISAYAFYDCVNLTNINIPVNLNTVGDYSFAGCSKLNNISLPTCVTSIGQYSFQNCISLKQIIIPNGMISIGKYAFQNCSGLTEIVFPNSVKSIGLGALSGCSSIERLQVPFVGKGCRTESDSEQFPIGYIFGEISYTGSIKTQQIYYGSGVSSLVNSTYYVPQSLKHITVTGGNILRGAFGNCSGLISITIPDTVSTIGSSAFSGCTKLEDIIIPESVNNIKDYGFYGCSSLTSITIPDSVTKIGEYAFYNCNNLKNAYYPGTQEQWDAISIEKNNNSLLAADLTVNYTIHDCIYNNWIISKQPTFTSLGEQYKVCSICGEIVTEPLEMLAGKVSHWNIVLEDDFKINFYLRVSEIIESTAKVRLMIGDEMLTYNISALEETEEGYYLLNAEVSAAQMNDYIVVMVMNGADIGSTATYSVKQYCDTILADDAQSQYHALVKEMLNYGAMAQVYFNYDADNLANTDITDVAGAEVPETTENLTVSDRIDSLNFYGASLVYREKIAVRYYFAGNVTGCTFSANGHTYTPIAKDAMYYIEIPDILPQNLDQQITLTVTDTEGNTLTVSYGPMNYIVRMNAKGSDDLKNLLKALYNYHLAAKAL